MFFIEGPVFHNKDFELCPICDWCHFWIQEEEPDRAKMENYLSLNEARQAYKEGKEVY